jgi:hypothetical protein
VTFCLATASRQAVSSSCGVGSIKYSMGPLRAAWHSGSPGPATVAALQPDNHLEELSTRAALRLNCRPTVRAGVSVT